MSTSYVEGVWRVEVVATKVTAQAQVSPVFQIPEGLTDLTVYLKGSAASTAKLEETPSSAAAIAGATATWMSVDASLDSVGTTMVRFPLGGRTPVAFRVSSLVTDQTATLIVTGRRRG